jgi:hypothetical protein
MIGMTKQEQLLETKEGLTILLQEYSQIKGNIAQQWVEGLTQRIAKIDLELYSQW